VSEGSADWLTRYGEPHLTWLVVALMIHRERLRWHHEVARDLIGGEDGEDALPGQPGWAYLLHGLGACLIGPDGEAIDSDFDEPSGAVIDVWFFARRIESVRGAAGWLAEHRLWRWRPSREVIVDGVEQLVGLGAAQFVGSGTKVQLAPELDERASEVAAALAAPHAILLGPRGRPIERAAVALRAPGSEAADAPASIAPGGEAADAPASIARGGEAADAPASIAPGSEAHDAAWLAWLEPGGEAAHAPAYRAWLCERVRISSRAGALLELALAGTSADEAVALCRPLLARPDWTAGRAIELLRARPDTPALPEVAALLRAASLDTDHPFAPLQACAYLLERGLERALAVERFDAWSQLERAAGYLGNPMLAQLALVALQLLPDRAMRVVRLALRSNTRLVVREITALLSAIDQPWCHRELAAASRRPDRDPVAPSPVAAALRAAYPPDWPG
jgi:hypothetical protein